MSKRRESLNIATLISRRGSFISLHSLHSPSLFISICIYGLTHSLLRLRPFRSVLDVLDELLRKAPEE
ncbi:hypothetical protein CAEBREN_02603 [Caenorhabditis brenneri]|uniref:Uncharacterized protein n=1 Tax=Caenorhabditis brenneri TaxID=135651 RepID=G0MVJ9_CAEBE|nr:hypothetical protein CAEBREN_02603 [Caenorhabditis brenneri]